MLKDRIKLVLKELIKDEEKVIVGVSGGPDSMCLLHLFMELNYNIVVAHINHCIREDAIEDEEYVKEFCNKYEIPIHIKRVDIKEKSLIEKIGIEEAGRKARYDFFEEVLKREHADKIATAHNKNDVAETLIMNILRGSGINGLKSIEATRNNKYIKPLIEIERFEIEQYCDINKLKPRIDVTNYDNTYTRNKIRNVVIPYIRQEFNPNIIKTLSRLTKLATDDINYIENQTKNIFKELLIEENDEQVILNLKEFNKQDIAIKKRLTLQGIELVSGTKKGIEKIHIDDIIKMCSNNIGNKYLTPNKNIKILLKKGQIIFTKNK